MTSESAVVNPVTTRPGEGRFYVGMALTALTIAIIGFGPALITPASRKAPVTLAVAAHGALFCAWLLLFLMQTILIPKGIAVHRRLGYLGIVLAALMVVTGYFTATTMARRGYDLSGDLMNTGPDALFISVFQFGDLLTFALLVSVAVWYRRRPDVHKRLMLLVITGTLVPAALTHIWGHSPGLRDIKAPIILIPLIPLLFAQAVHDRLSRGRIHPVSLWVALALLTWTILRAVVIGPSQTWHNIANWVIR